MSFTMHIAQRLQIKTLYVVLKSILSKAQYSTKKKIVSPKNIKIG